MEHYIFKNIFLYTSHLIFNVQMQNNSQKNQYIVVTKKTVEIIFDEAYF